MYFFIYPSIQGNKVAIIIEEDIVAILKKKFIQAIQFRFVVSLNVVDHQEFLKIKMMINTFYLGLSRSYIFTFKLVRSYQTLVPKKKQVLDMSMDKINLPLPLPITHYLNFLGK